MQSAAKKIILSSLLLSYAVPQVAMQPTIVPPAPATKASTQASSGSWLPWVPTIACGIWSAYELMNAWFSFKKLNQKKIEVESEIEALRELDAFNTDKNENKTFAEFEKRTFDSREVNKAIIVFGESYDSNNSISVAKSLLDTATKDALRAAQEKQKTLSSMRLQGLARPAIALGATAAMFGLTSACIAQDSSANRGQYAMACAIKPEVRTVIPTADHYVRTLQVQTVAKNVIGTATVSVPAGAYFVNTRKNINAQLASKNEPENLDWLRNKAKKSEYHHRSTVASFAAQSPAVKSWFAKFKKQEFTY